MTAILALNRGLLDQTTLRNVLRRSIPAFFGGAQRKGGDPPLLSFGPWITKTFAADLDLKPCGGAFDSQG